MATCVIAVVGAAPCQCLTPAGIHTTSPGRISYRGPCHRCTRPTPAVTTSRWPRGCVCHAVRAPGSNVTYAAPALATSFGSNSGSIRAAPVKYSAGPRCDAREPLRVTPMVSWAEADLPCERSAARPVPMIIVPAAPSSGRVTSIAATSVWVCMSGSSDAGCESQSSPSGAIDLLDSAARVLKHHFTMNEDLNAMVASAAVAEARGFRAAGERLGVSASAVSQALRKLEEH